MKKFVLAAVALVSLGTVGGPLRLDEALFLDHVSTRRFVSLR